jgi:putative membrane protein
MKQIIAAISLCILVAGPASAQSAGDKTGVNSVIGIAPSTADFVTQAAASDMFEIQSSQLALHLRPANGQRSPEDDVGTEVAGAKQ